MRPTASPWRALTAGALVAVIWAGSASAAVPTPMTGRGPYGELRSLADLSARRLGTAVAVAAAKWGTGGPVDDPAREQQVLDAAARRARAAGADPVTTVKIFRDQIEANKQVQRALHSRWQANPEEVPGETPDLSVVREKINRLNLALVRVIAVSAAPREASSCRAGLAVAAVRVRHDRRLDRVHAAALARALRSVCAGAPDEVP
ncbi:chorismate mutase [Streptomyces sp. QL37]|uniref:chorismate mutase n=1 Tax=Streptomyces sp. QL37 TaxID=2093747 RepID=UPI000CF20948|nr:chorismate mutase [Streptomyces sp. QL37]PPQ61853.1 chorismate mutase [Streptomyces sp. QL37]